MDAVCLIANRPQKIPFAEGSRQHIELMERMRTVLVQLIEEGYTNFITGMSPGAETWFAECILDLKDIYPDVELEAAVPYVGQSDRLAAAVRFRYDKILATCAEVTYVSNIYSKYCISKRNKYMVNKSGVVLIANFTRDDDTVKIRTYAERRKKYIIDL